MSLGSRIADVIEEMDSLKDRSSKERVPTSFIPVKKVFQKAMDNQEEILIEEGAFRVSSSVVITLDYVGDRWCKGHSVRYTTEGIEKVPYTIAYYDVVSRDETDNQKPKIIFRGDNPFA